MFWILHVEMDMGGQSALRGQRLHRLFCLRYVSVCEQRTDVTGRSSDIFWGGLDTELMKNAMEKLQFHLACEMKRKKKSFRWTEKIKMSESQKVVFKRKKERH